MDSSHDHFIEVGSRHLASYDFPRAIKAFGRALAVDAKSNLAKEKLGHCYRKLGKNRKALEILDQISETDDNAAKWRLERAQILADLGKAGRAEKDYKYLWDTSLDGSLALELGVSGWAPGLTYATSSAGGSNSKLIAKLDLAARVPHSVTEEDECRYIEDLSALNDQTPEFWLYLYARLLSIGHPYAALKAKFAAAREVLRSADLTPPATIDALENAVAAAIYIEAFKEAEALIRNFKSAGGSASDWDRHRCNVDLLLSQGKIEEARAVFTRVEFKSANRAFQALLAGRSCAVVGPATNTLGNGAEIDSHDFVVRTNFVGDDIIHAHGDTLGRRTDISYYNVQFLDARESQVIDAMRNASLQFAVMRLNNVRKKYKKEAPNLPIRRWISYRKWNFIGIGFAMRHIPFELVLFSDKPLFVYGADFYLNAKTHYEGYFDEGIDVAREFARHDPFDTFIFLQALWKAKAIVPDQVLAEILSDPLEVFAQRLSRKFRKAQ